MTKQQEQIILDQIADIYGQLSPENLTCDGELPMATVRKRSAKLHRELQACFKKLGRTVSETEAFQVTR